MALPSPRGARLVHALLLQSLGLDLSGVFLDRLGILFEDLGDSAGAETVTRGAIEMVQGHQEAALSWKRR